MTEPFYATFPCYVFADPPFRKNRFGDAIIDGETNFLIQCARDAARPAIPAFTDIHLAQSFRSESKLSPKTQMIPIPTEEYFSTLLKGYRARRDQEADLVFDQTKTWGGWLVTYEVATSS